MRQTAAALSVEKAEGLFNFLMDLENQEDISQIATFMKKITVVGGDGTAVALATYLTL